jgi:ABC-2 type transport system permease protein
MLQRIWAVMQKEFVQTLRDRGTLMIILGIPMIQLFLFGYAITMNVDHMPMIVADQSLDSASQAYVDALTASSYFDVVEYAHTEAEAVWAIDAGRVQVGVVIPPDFAAHVERGDAQALILVDGSDPFTTQSAYNAVSVIAQAHASSVLMEKVARSGSALAGQGASSFNTLTRVLYNPNQANLWFVIPGMIALLLQNQTIVLTAVAVVREREVGTLEQILVTPIRPYELLLGKIAPNLVIALVIMLAIVGTGVSWFGVPFQGNFWLFIGLTFLYVFCGLGLGLLVSSVSQTQQQAQQLSMMLIMLGLILGGFTFPRYTMPAPLQLVGYLFPLTWFIPIVRGIITKGVGLEVLWRQVIALAAYIVVIMFFAARAFRQGLD